MADYIELLEDMQSVFSGQIVDSTVAETVIFALDQIASFLLDEDNSISEIPVLTRNGNIVQACDVFEFDAPWWEGKIQPGQIHLLDSRVPIRIREQAKINQLSKCVFEKPLELPDAVDIPEIVEQCTIWQHTLQSKEFGLGLERIIRHNHQFGNISNLRILQQLIKAIIVPVEKIQTKLILINDGTIIGHNDGDYYYDEKNSTFFVVAKNEDDLDFVPEFLAQSLNEQFDSHTLSDLSPLVKIVDLPPERIDATLTRLRIRQLSYQEAVYSPITVEEDEDEFEGQPESEPLSQEEEPNNSDTGKVTESNRVLTNEHEETDTSANTQIPPELNTPETAEGTNLFIPVRRQRGSSARRRLSGTPVKSHPGETGPRSQSQTVTPTNIGDNSSEGNDSINNIVDNPSYSQNSDSLGSINSHPEGIHDSGEIRRWPRMKRNSHSGQAHLTISRVFSQKHKEKLQKLESADDEAPHNIEVGEAAVQRVLDFETNTGCAVEKMPHNNPGFDVISVTPDGNTTKYIEVKGIDGPWTEDGVPLSPTQFIFGQRHEKSPGEEFWLYVVEYAKDEERFRVYPIPNPTSQVTQFRFDSGWREMAINFEKPLEPAVGLKIQLEDGRTGTILQVNGEGIMRKLTISFDDGTEERVKFRKSSMVVFQLGE